ncbi:hypothetical protein FML45_22400 [Klebsiella variicola]|nr:MULTISPECIES: hypothetical protein [Klebsiella]EEQ4612453.1 hypothetical protein [Escherichia coli]MDI9194240.1 hypothetical protein [Raoultella ornithinolytica]HBX3727770.1 hypothetical protein [Klebsiella pneumoniae subsp. pneumoniae]ASG36893.1 hypothetical protein CES89_26095 [Klebsiella pneumoniae]EJZ0016309.1 hypothetical protein [Escherichia coli]
MKRNARKWIPFGFDKDTNQIVDIASVENGLSCNCICLICGTSLIARQGQSKKWHFSHSTDVKGVCSELTLQHLKKYIQMKIQEKKFLALPHLLHGKEKGVVTLKNITAGGIVCGLNADLIGQCNDTTIGIFINDTAEDIQPNPDLLAQTGQLALVEIDAVRIESIVAPYREKGEGIKLMDAVEKLLFVSEEAKKWIYHPMMKRVKPEALHQYKREFTSSGNQLLALIPHELPISMNVLPSSPSLQWHHLRCTINLLCSLSRADIPPGSKAFDELVYFIPRLLEASESINVPAYERWYDFFLRKRGDGELNDAELAFIGFIVKIINWNMSIHNMPGFDDKQAFHDWFLLNDRNK